MSAERDRETEKEKDIERERYERQTDTDIYIYGHMHEHFEHIGEVGLRTSSDIFTNDAYSAIACDKERNDNTMQ